MTPTWISVLVMALAAGMALVAVTAIGTGGRTAGDPRSWRLGVTAAVFLAAWGLTASLVAVKATLPDGSPRPWAPVAVAINWVVMVAAVFAASRWIPRVRTALRTRAAMLQLAALEIARVVGFIFLVLHARGDLPGAFAYPAGWGDIAVGVSALFIVALMLRRYDDLFRAGSGARRAFVAWNVIGFADMAMAITLGITHFPGWLQVAESNPSTVLFGQLPLVLFPTFLVPIAATVHLILLDGIRNAGRLPQ